VSAQEVFEALGVELEPEPEVVEPETDGPEEPPLPFFMGESLDAEIDRLLDETYVKRDCKKKTTGETGHCAVVSHKTKKQKACYDDCDTAKKATHLEEEELEEMSMSGGSVSGFAGPGRREDEDKPKSLIREDEPEVVEEVLNYLLGKMEIL